MPEIKRRKYEPAMAAALYKNGVSSALSRVYAGRNISDLAELSYEISGLLPPHAMKGVDKAAEILAEAIYTDRHVVIAGDFDVDGCSASAIAVRGLKMMGLSKLSFALPRRDLHGYGLSPLLVQEIHANFNPDLIMTVDCGVSSYDGVEEARKLNIRCLITDHHLCADDKPLPDALAIVNPNQPGCEFGEKGSKNLCGAGVIFYVMLVLRTKLRLMGYFEGKKEPNLATLLDLVALATIADVVKLDTNNRRIVSLGLARIRAGKCCEGIKEILAVAGRDYTKVTVFDLGFIIGPRLNAAGRLEDATIGLKCLTTDDPAVARDIATRLHSLNKERKEIEAKMKESAEVEIGELDVSQQFSLVMYQPEWHQGVIGILASRLKDRYSRPTIVFAKAEDGKLKGSGRSIPGIHLRDALDLIDKRHPGVIQAFGGHSAACGAAIAEDRLKDFKDALEEVVRSQLTEADLQQVIVTDGCLAEDEMTLDTADEIARGIWGQGFQEPLFDGEFVVLEQQIIKEKHLRLKLAKNGNTYQAMWFFRNELTAARARFVFSLSVNEFRGEKNLQLLIKEAVPV